MCVCVCWKGVGGDLGLAVEGQPLEHERGPACWAGSEGRGDGLSVSASPAAVAAFWLEGSSGERADRSRGIGGMAARRGALNQWHKGKATTRKGRKPLAAKAVQGQGRKEALASHRWLGCSTDSLPAGSCRSGAAAPARKGEVSAQRESLRQWKRNRKVVPFSKERPVTCSVWVAVRLMLLVLMTISVVLPKIGTCQPAPPRVNSAGQHRVHHLNGR